MGRKLDHSAGHWEGDTLVVETAGFNNKTFLDATGAPHSDELRTVERLRKFDGGRRLEDVVTINDPELLTKPITARYIYESQSGGRIAAICLR